jgi:hypothetical protein
MLHGSIESTESLSYAQVTRGTLHETTQATQAKANELMF